MAPLTDTITTPAVAEYLLLLEPRKDLSDYITTIKQAFYDRYKAPEALKGKPHLTLVHYTQYTTFESRIRQRLRTLSLQTTPFSVELQDFGSFPTHTIFINVVTRTAIQTLVKNIRTHLQGMMKMDKENKPHFILEPHITIARKLKPWQYEQGWMEYSHNNFSGKFIATEMTLLKKGPGAGKYELVEKYALQSIPVNASQAMLF
ncbi:MAG: 2'-5' RNA ligase family protein [Niabella sp.]